MSHLTELLRCEVQRDIALSNEQRLRKAVIDFLEILSAETHLSETALAKRDEISGIIAKRETLGEIVVGGQFTVA